MAYMQIRTNTCIYVQIHKYTFKYKHIHSNMYNRSMPLDMPRNMQLTLAGPLGHGTGTPLGQGPRNNNTIHSVPGSVAERDSQAQVQVGPQVDKGLASQPISVQPGHWVMETAAGPLDTMHSVDGFRKPDQVLFFRY